MSASQEEDELREKREAVKVRAESKARQQEVQVANRHAAQLDEARAWRKRQPKSIQARVDQDAEARVRLVYHDLRDAPKGYVESALIEAVNAVRRSIAGRPTGVAS